MNLKIKNKNQDNLSKSFKLELISKTCNSWNTRFRLNQETQFQNNLILNDEIEKK
jgi:hypothetical protein